MPESSKPAGPLAGVKVISFGAFVAGNVAAQLLAGLGADVIKVESKGRPEVLRTPVFAIGDAFVEPSGVPNTVMYASLSRGTRNVAIDLALPDARPLFQRLVAEADVLIENFGRPVLDSWGCAYQDLLRHNPKLVMLSLSGYGRSGPRANFVAYASTVASFVGLASAWGYTHGTLGDYLAAATGVTAVLAAWRRARATGAPSYLDVAQIDAMPPVMADLLAEPLNSGGDRPWRANHVPGSWLSGVFRARGFDDWLAVELEDAEDWALLCDFLGRPELRAVDRGTAQGLEPELAGALEAWVSQHSAFVAMHAMQKAGLAAAVVQSSEDLWRDAQLAARAFAQQADNPDIGTVTYPGSVQRWTKTPGRLRFAPARLGQHTYEVLTEWIRMPPEQLKELAQKEVIFDAARQHA